MSSLLKDLYSQSFYDQFSDCLVQVIPSFDKKKFIKNIFTPDFKDKEFKERMKHTAQTLHQFLPADYAKAVKMIRQIIMALRKAKFKDNRLEFIFFPDYIETYGLDDYDHSVTALEFITQFITCEYAVRPFIIKYEDRMIKQMAAWSLHENEWVRRLSSEGIRPRLPWAMALPVLKKNPAPILPILENLKNDVSETVRRSVANNLNDIAKDNPGFVLGIAKKWKGISKETDAIIKHGCRTLLKNGHAEVLQLYGLESKHGELTGLIIHNPEIKIGQSLEFSFSLFNKSKRAQTMRLEYAIDYQRSNGQLSRKVFKISERAYQPGEIAEIRRKQRFVLITTRKFYSGRHQLSVIINGKEKATADFKLNV